LFISFQGGLGPPLGVWDTVAAVAVPLGALVPPELAHETRKRIVPAAPSAARAVDEIVAFIRGLLFRGTSMTFD
jgi:hypothetical protein